LRTIEQGGSEMATKRIRGTKGHNVCNNKLQKELKKYKSELSKEEEKKKPSKKIIKNIRKIIEVTENSLKGLSEKFNKQNKDEFNHVSRLSVQVNPSNPPEEEYARALFEEMTSFQQQGLPVPPELEARYQSIRKAPDYEVHLEILAHSYAALCNKQENPIDNVPWEMFISQSQINPTWIEYQGITEKKIRERTKKLLLESNSELLFDKNYLFIGSFMSFTANPEFARTVSRMIKNRELDGIIIAGPWTKDIYLHKTFGNTIIPEVRDIIKSTKIISIRSNQENVEYLPELIDLGVQFVTNLSNEHNTFYGDRFSTTSTKNQLNIFRDIDEVKNIFAYTSYVAFETILKRNKIKYIVGSGSASINTGRSATFTQASSRQILNSAKYDSTGGHLLRFDKEGHVSVSSFHYSSKLKGAPLAGNFYSSEKGARVVKTKLAVLASDLHVSHMDMNCFSAFLNYLERRKDDISVLHLNGDFFDNAVMSHWNEQKIGEQIRISKDSKLGCFLHEVHRARVAIDMIVSRLNPDTELYFKWGNHEINSLEKIKNKSLMHFLSAVLNLEDLLDLNKYGFKTIGSKDCFWLGDLPILHGHELSPNQARQNLGRKVVMGHSHQCKIGNYGTVLPSMHKKDGVGYANYHYQNWAPGWGISHIVEDAYTKVELVLMHDENSYYDSNERIFIEKNVDIQVDEREIPLLLKY